jgi:hypothetical protein
VDIDFSSAAACNVDLNMAMQTILFVWN